MARVKAGDGGNGSKRPRVDLEEFVKHWTKARSASDVAEHFKITTQYAYQIARNLRDQGVQLKQFKRGRKVDAARLNKIIEEIE